MLIWGAKRQPTEARPDRRGDAGRIEVSQKADFLAFLGRAGHLEAQQIERIEAASAVRSFDCLPVLMTEMGLMPEHELTQLLAAFTGLDVTVREDLPQAPILIEELSRDFCQRQRILPIAADDRSATIAVVDVLDRQFMASLAYALNGRAVTMKVIGAATQEAAFRSLYGEEEVAGELDDDLADDALDRLEDISRRAPIIRLANQLFRTAFEHGATDIHIEPGETDLRVRYRVDGTLVFPEVYSKSVHNGLATRIKILAGLNIAERRLPQDGRLKMVDRGSEVDVRVSVLPTPHGESLVLRLLGRRVAASGFESLGLDHRTADLVERMVRRPNGLFLVTGPTGSGKTTTLYTALDLINDQTRKIITVEDPVEYRIGGVTQVQAHADIGLDFAAALRSILRQDPDVVMIGEIRDGETARIAVQAALTGHLVLSTLHTNSAAATITRLLDMGLQSYLLAAVLNGVVAQRLIRLLCADCKVIEPASPEELVLIRHYRPDLAGKHVSLARPVGCPHCSGTGFRGRRIVAEALELDRHARQLVSDRADEAVIEDHARTCGFGSLAAAGIERALNHETSLQEVERILEVEIPASANMQPTSYREGAA